MKKKEDRGTLIMVCGALLVSVITLTIAYAVLSTTLTIKHILKNDQSGIQQMKETEIVVDSFEETNELLENLGFYYRCYQEKRRIKYILNEPAKTLKNFLKDNHLNCVQLGKWMKTSPAVIRKWTRGNHVMTEYSFIKMKKALKENGYSLFV